MPAALSCLTALSAAPDTVRYEYISGVLAVDGNVDYSPEIQALFVTHAETFRELRVSGCRSLSVNLCYNTLS